MFMLQIKFGGSWNTWRAKVCSLPRGPLNSALRNLGSSGYQGKIGTYLETSTVKSALDTDGAMLDFFRASDAF